MDNGNAQQLLGLLQVGREGIIHMDRCIQQGELTPSDIGILDSLLELLEAIETMTLALATVPHRTRQIILNLTYYIERMQRAVTAEPEVFLYDFHFHFYSLFRILEYEIAYVVEAVVDKQAYPHLYPEVGTVDHTEIFRRGEKAACKVSVILLAYNNLAVTRDCIESILACTNDVEYELILVDNGSTDGVKEYFDSIKGAKVIHLPFNLHVVKGFNMGLMAAEGKYCAAVCNDFIFTPNWLRNLLLCIESDPRIGFVAPGATSISNMQQISIPFTSIEAFQAEAKKYNVSNPRKWEERVVLLPNVLCCPTALLERIGYYDTRYFRGEFGDDDISFRIRRAGYKLIYCADTVTHHYGSLTTVSEHQTNSLQEGRQTFIERYGMDAWEEARMLPFYSGITFQRLSHVRSILGLDVKCGATLLQIKNQLWAQFGVQPSMISATAEEKYRVDLQTISDGVFIINNLQELTEKVKDKVDLIYIEKPLDCYSEDLDVLFKSVSLLLNRNGQIIFTVNGSTSLEILYQLLHQAPLLNARRIYTDIFPVQKALSHGFVSPAMTNITAQYSHGAEQIIRSISDLLVAGDKDTAARMGNLMQISLRLYQMSYSG